MSKVKSDFKVFVSDEILDFRTLEEKYNRTSPRNFLPRTQSQDAIDINKHKDVPITNRQVTTPENISKPLYNSTTSFADKYRYPRLKSRSRTVDPRFRKSRSPTHKLLTGSQSTADITNPSMSQNQAKKKPFSPSHLSSSVNRDLKKPPKYTRDSKETEVESPVNLQHKHAAEEQEKYKYTALDDVQKIYNQYTIEANEEQKICNTTSSEQEKYDINAIGDACDISPVGPPEITEDETMEESVSQINAGDMELGDGYMDKISPYWDDPRLLEKHNIMKPVRSQTIKNSLGVPLLVKDHSPNGLLVCRNCLTTQWVSPEYKYDDRTEICNSSLISNDDVFQRKYTEKDEYSTMVPYMALGSAVGILIVSFLTWLVTQHVSWDFYKLWPGETSPPPPEASVLIYVKNCGENVLYWMDTLYAKAYEIILMPRSGILNHDVGTDEPSRWWSNKM